LPYGRQNALTLDGVIAYDPMGGSGAFSVIGFQGATAGMGDTENARLDNSFKYTVNVGRSVPRLLPSLVRTATVHEMSSKDRSA
jgi:hypothetical protein